MVIAGAVGAAVTVSVAGGLVTVPSGLVTVTVKTEPVSPITVDGVV